jgi:HK97 family phage portal protein
MSFFDRFRNVEKRAQTVRTSDPFLAEFFNVRGVGAVTPETVLSNSAVAVRCISLRSELLASVGLFTFRRTKDGGRERANDNPLYAVLHDNANPQMGAFEFREFLIRCLDLHGNAFARIERDNKGQVVHLWPLLPGTVTVERLPSGRLRYKVSQRGEMMVLLQDEVLHLRGPSRDGIMGQSAIQIARGTLGLNMAQIETANGVMGNSLRTSGILSFAEKMSDVSKERLRSAVSADFTGPNNAGKMLILDGGAKYDPTSMTPEDAQFLDSRKLSNEDTARLFGVPPTSVGILDRGTYSNVEQESASLIQNCLGPLAARIESALMRCLLTDTARQSLYIEHDLSGLLRGDVKSRFDAYRIGREIGALSANDIRRRENEPPIADGNGYHMPANWIPLGTKPIVAGAA